MSTHQADDGTTRQSYYGAGRQPWDDIKDQGWGPAFAAGNVLKYLRRPSKCEPEKDLEKARWYFDELRKRIAIDGAEVYAQLINLLTSEELLQKLVR